MISSHYKNTGSKTLQNPCTFFLIFVPRFLIFVSISSWTLQTSQNRYINVFKNTELVFWINKFFQFLLKAIEGEGKNAKFFNVSRIQQKLPLGVLEPTDNKSGWKNLSDVSVMVYTSIFHKIFVSSFLIEINYIGLFKYEKFDFDQSEFIPSWYFILGFQSIKKSVLSFKLFSEGCVEFLSACF